MTANRLGDGVVVYLTAQDTWLPEIASAVVATDQAALAHLEAVAKQAADRRLIVAVYAMDVGLETHGPVPLSVRERIRAAHKPTF